MVKKLSESKKLKLISNSYLAIGIFLIILGTLIIILARYPHVWYSLSINTPENEFVTLTQQLDVEKIEYEEKKEEIEWEDIKTEIPPLDTSLPLENHIIINKVGIKAKIYDGTNYEQLLEEGIWRVFEFGTPEDNNTIILAGHRFGYFTWSQEQRNSQSFFHLPSTRVGDKIEIIWNQRKYTYEIYRLEEDTKITDYTADLILYTCKLYDSPIRIFRYASRVN